MAKVKTKVTVKRPKKHTYCFMTRCVSLPMFAIDANSLKQAIAIFEGPDFRAEPCSEEVEMTELVAIYDENNVKVGPPDTFQPLGTLPITRALYSKLLRGHVSTTEQLVALAASKPRLLRIVDYREMQYLLQLLEALRLYNPHPCMENAPRKD